MTDEQMTTGISKAKKEKDKRERDRDRDRATKGKFDIFVVLI